MFVHHVNTKPVSRMESLDGGFFEVRSRSGDPTTEDLHARTAQPKVCCVCESNTSPKEGVVAVRNRCRGAPFMTPLCFMNLVSNRAMKLFVGAVFALGNPCGARLVGWNSNGVICAAVGGVNLATAGIQQCAALTWLA